MLIGDPGHFNKKLPLFHLKFWLRFIVNARSKTNNNLGSCNFTAIFKQYSRPTLTFQSNIVYRFFWKNTGNPNTSSEILFCGWWYHSAMSQIPLKFCRLFLRVYWSHSKFCRLKCKTIPLFFLTHTISLWIKTVYTYPGSCFSIQCVNKCRTHTCKFTCACIRKWFQIYKLQLRKHDIKLINDLMIPTQILFALLCKHSTDMTQLKERWGDQQQ